MKWLAVTGAALLLLLGATLGVYCYLESSAETVCRELEGLALALEGEDWQQAELALGQAEELWQQSRPRWAVLIDHKEMEDIDICFVDINSAIRRQDRDSALKEEAELEFFLRQAPDGERPGWDNIL